LSKLDFFIKLFGIPVKVCGKYGRRSKSVLMQEKKIFEKFYSHQFKDLNGPAINIT